MAIVRPRPKPTTTQKPTSPEPVSAGKIETKKPTPPSRKPAPRKSAELPKKEEPSHEPQKTQEQPQQAQQDREKQEAPKPTVPAGEPDRARLGRASSTETDEHDETEGQLTYIQLQKLDILERHALWKKLNRKAEAHQFFTVLHKYELPKRMVRDVSVGKAPTGRNVLWCCYCADWNVFETFSYVGYRQCVCCGMSTKDFHNRSANNLWKEDI